MTARPSKRDRTAPRSFPVRTGDLAYYDGFIAGLVPVKVLAIRKVRTSAGPRVEVTVRATGARVGYKRGEVFTVTHPELFLAARDQVRRRRFRTVLIGKCNPILDDPEPESPDRITVTPDTKGVPA